MYFFCFKTYHVILYSVLNDGSIMSNLYVMFDIMNLIAMEVWDSLGINVSCIAFIPYYSIYVTNSRATRLFDYSIHARGSRFSKWRYI